MTCAGYRGEEDQMDDALRRSESAPFGGTTRGGRTASTGRPDHAERQRRRRRGCRRRTVALGEPGVRRSVAEPTNSRKASRTDRQACDEQISHLHPPVGFVSRSLNGNHPPRRSKVTQPRTRHGRAYRRCASLAADAPSVHDPAMRSDNGGAHRSRGRPQPHCAGGRRTQPAW